MPAVTGSASQIPLISQTAGSKNRLYQEKQSKTESAENADTVLDIPE